MGVDLAPLVVKKEISLSDLKGKKLAIDTHLVLHQFLTTMPFLSDSKGRLTTHLQGLFYRVTHLLAEGMKPAFVFDGLGEGVPRTSITITPQIIEESKLLLEYLGCPVVQAPSEGEAQCAFMAKQGKVWAAASQDYDSLMFGAPKLIRNLTISKYRKLPKGGKAKVKPELLLLKDFFHKYKINQKQLIALCMLIGTDFNPKVPKIGPMSAVKLVKGKSLENIFKNFNLEYDWKEVFNFLAKIPVIKHYKLKWEKPNANKIRKFLCEERDFKVERVMAALEKIK
jgi:flap endonuclease-1